MVITEPNKSMFKSNLFIQLCALNGRVIFDVPINKINYIHACRICNS